MTDFFSGAPLRSNMHDESVQGFANAIQERYSPSDRRLLTARLTPALQERSSHSCPAPPPVSSSIVVTVDSFAHLSLKYPQTLASRSSSNDSYNIPGPSRILSTPNSDDFPAISPNALPQILHARDILILDIRPHSTFLAARLPHAISLSVPSTLLKRPAFTLEKLSSMLASASAKSRFNAWPTASRILVYDAESTSLHQSSHLSGLLRKFRAEGFKGDVAWLQGGLQALWRSHRHLVNEGPPSDDEDEAEDSSFVRARDIPMAAFQRSTTATMTSRIKPNESPRSAHSSPFSQRTLTMASSRRSAPPLRLDQTTALSAANPFYDNIRQNVELSQGITERIPLLLSPEVVARFKDLPFPWLREIADWAGQDASTDTLAMQFYRIELREQKRLQGVMAYHSKQSGSQDCRDGEIGAREERFPATSFPYSITAGIEKGEKNRYRNIWPFEHARVRLTSPGLDDYVNASYVQPIGTRKRYIATQGPLSTTYSDFWTLVWEQNVRVVVMITRQYEGPDIKCGKYWSNGRYGPLRLTLVSETGAKPEVEPATSSSSFNFVSSAASKANESRREHSPEDNHTIRRVFELSHSCHPGEPPRIVTHYQYLGWPDMDVPSNPRGVLRLVREVDAAVDNANEETGMTCPALLHCSAGVGRTGSFIVLDAILDGVRRELRKRFSTSNSSTSESSSERSSDSEKGSAAMDIDSKSVRTAHPTRILTASSTAHPSASSSTPRLTNTGSQTFHNREILQTKLGMVAALPMGSSSNLGRVTDIHVPLVPSTAPTTSSTVPQQSLSRPFGSRSTTSHDATLTRPVSQPSPSSQVRARNKSIAPEFTAADADLMFTGSALNPAFAMDVEQYSGGLTQRSTSTNGSSSGEGNTKHDSSSLVLPIAAALARLSSSDDIPGRSGHSDRGSDHKHGARGRTGSGSGSASGGAGSGSGGGYSSSSSQVPSGISSSSSSGRVTFALGKPPSAPIQSHAHHRGNNVFADSVASRHGAVPFPHIRPSGSGSSASSANEHHSKHHHSSSSSALSTDARSPIMSPTPYESSETTVSRSMTPPNKQTHVRRGAAVDTMFDCSFPRVLHDERSPPLLSTLEEPVREILDDMREQRMSLCQSLRQYVFVHSAIIEGSLQILDEEVERATKAGMLNSGSDSNLSDPSVVDAETINAPAVTAVHHTGKRGASPTELPKEGKKGEVVLSKRPSLKRGKSTSSGDSGGSSPT